jgi:hypothetical protein
MTKLIRGQRAKINGLYDDPISLNIIESDELNNVLEKIIKSSNVPNTKHIAAYEEEAAT